MAERKAQNKYYPPDFNPAKHKNLDHYHGTHRLRERAAKIGQGIIVIRFEMPFNIWCSGCKNHIGMGVRYNAEKKKCGYFYSTPLFNFRMRCHLCPNYFVIQNDPENFDYKLIEGCTRQEKRWDPSEDGANGFAPIDRGEAHRLAADAMYKLEKSNVDKETAKLAEPEIIKLEKVQKIHKDDFAANQMARSLFRKEKNDKSSKEALDKALMERHSLAGGRVKLLAENADDQKMAHLIAQARTLTDSDVVKANQRESIEAASIFKHRNAPKKTPPSSVCSQSTSTLSSTASTRNELKQLAKEAKTNLKQSIQRSALSSEKKRKKEALDQMQVIKSLVKPKMARIDDQKASTSLVQYTSSDSD